MLKTDLKQDLQTFLIQRHCGEILERGKNKDAQISEEDRKLLIKNAFAYISAKFHQVQKFHIVLLAKTLVSLVPCLTDSSEGEYSGFVCFLCMFTYIISRIDF